MNSHNPRLERLRELMSLEERRVSAQQELESISQRMSSLRDSLFEEGGSAAASVSSTSRSSAAQAQPAAAIPAKRGRKPGASGKRNKRGALKEMILEALHAAGNAGIRVTELAQSFGMKPVNIHSWFHSSIKRYPQIKKVKGGHYRLEGKLDSAPASVGRPKTSASPKASQTKPATRQSASKGRGKTSGTRRGALSEQVLGELKKAGAKGVSVREIADRIGANYRNIYIWFATTGKKNGSVKKIAPAQYRLAA